jgi:hypothetical protein
MTGDRQGSSDQNEFDYLRRVEMIARELVGCAHDEGWLSYTGDPDSATPLQRAANELARTLRHHHFDDNDHERCTSFLAQTGRASSCHP